MNNNNNKGFTMVELLVAMAIMGLLVIMAFPTIRVVQINNTEKKYQEYGNAAISAAKLYTDSYGEDLFVKNVTNQYRSVSFEELVKKDLLKDINVSDSTCIKQSKVVIVKYSDDYAYCLDLKCTAKGSDDLSNYLYKEKNRKGSCQKFVELKVKYTYNSKDYILDVIKDDIHTVLKPEQAGFDLAKEHVYLDFWDGNVGVKKPGDNITLQGNVDFVAEVKPFNYIIRFKSGLSGTTGTMGEQTCTYGRPCKLYNSTFKKDCYIFDYWKYGNVNIKDGDDFNNYLDKINITKNNQVIELTGSYKITKVNVKYNSNGGSLANPHSSKLTLSGNKILVNKNEVHHTINCDSKLSSDGLVNWNNSSYLNLLKKGYTIKSKEEWNTSASGNGTTFNQTDAYSAKQLSSNVVKGDSTVTLYPKWIPKTINVTFDCNGGTGGGTQTFTYGVSGQKFNKTCIKSGYSLNGWKKVSTSNKSDYSVASGVSGDWIDTYAPSIKLYAHWGDPNVSKCEIKVSNSPKGANGWYRENVNITMTTFGVVTSKGLATSKGSTNGKTTASITNSSTPTYYCYVSNKSGSFSNSINIKLDKTNPKIKLTVESRKENYNSKNIKYTITTSDGLSGIDKYCVNVGGKCDPDKTAKGTITNNNFDIGNTTLDGNSKTIYACVSDKAGNINCDHVTYKVYKDCQSKNLTVAYKTSTYYLGPNIDHNCSLDGGKGVNHPDYGYPRKSSKDKYKNLTYDRPWAMYRFYDYKCYCNYDKNTNNYCSYNKYTNKVEHDDGKSYNKNHMVIFYKKNDDGKYSCQAFNNKDGEDSGWYRNQNVYVLCYESEMTSPISKNDSDNAHGYRFYSGDEMEEVKYYKFIVGRWYHTHGERDDTYNGNGTIYDKTAPPESEIKKSCKKACSYTKLTT